MGSVNPLQALGCHALLLAVTPPQLPENLLDMCGHLDEVEERLAKKGIGLEKGFVPLPDRFQKVIARLREAGKQAMAEAKRQDA